jgi:hypothetical protein
LSSASVDRVVARPADEHVATVGADEGVVAERLQQAVIGPCKACDSW